MFDKNEAADAAARVSVARSADVIGQVQRELAEALECSRQYAEHLELGGDPLAFPKTDRGDGRRAGSSRLVSIDRACTEVARRWQEARGSRNVYLPTEGRVRFEVGEYVAARIGEPIPYATFREKWREVTTSDSIARVLVGFEQRTEDLVIRRCKVNGKVAFVVRERRNDDPVRDNVRVSNMIEEG